VNSAIPIQQKSVRFRARSFVAFVLSPEAPLRDWLRDLDRWTQNSPGFFVGRPVVLDLSTLKPESAEIASLVAALAERGIRILAIEMPDVETLGPDLPPILKGTRAAVIEEAKADNARNSKGPVSAPQPAPPPEPSSLILESPIRSGQSIIHPYGDVIVLGSVGSGSEVVAGGSIHVYGTLRGRAMAGAMGNAKARIFCKKNEAELMAVDGCYRTAEDMDPSSRGKPVQSFLDDGVLWISVLD
jgi:septum site-determining protein MinC